jgi:hypothetical protein
MNNMKTYSQKIPQLKLLFVQQIFCTPNQKLSHIKTFTSYVIINILLVSAVGAQTNDVLPPRILELVPQGTKLLSQNFTGNPTMAVAEFSAEKSIKEGRSVNYQLVIRAFDNSSPTWKMRETAYRKQMEARIEEHRSSLTPESANQGMFTADPVKETKNGWGTTLTQRLLNHPPNASQYIDYQCAYFGIIGGIVFELYVSGVPDSTDEADQWAQKVVQLASKLSISNIGNQLE